MPNPLFDALKTRRSVSVKCLAEPGPSRAQIETLLTIATRVPDHGKLAPWKLHIFDKAAQAALGERWAEIYARNCADDEEITEKHIAHERDRPQRAPLMIAVVSKPVMGKIPVWEQQLSAGAVCMNLLHAAQAMGFAANWLSEWPCFDAQIQADLGCEAGDQIAGFIYIGTPAEPPKERVRPELGDVVQWH